MKLESLKSSKFEAFKGKELKNPLMVVGGLTAQTTWRDLHGSGSGKDTFDYGPDAPTRKVVLSDLGGGDLTLATPHGEIDVSEDMLDEYEIFF